MQAMSERENPVIRALGQQGSRQAMSLQAGAIPIRE